MNERNESHGESKGLSYSENENPVEYLEDETQIERDTAPPGQKKKIVAAPHKKSKQIRSNKQDLSEITQSLKLPNAILRSGITNPLTISL